MTAQLLHKAALAALACVVVLTASRAGQGAAATALVSPTGKIPSAAAAATPRRLQRYRAGMAAVLNDRADFSECDVGDSITEGVSTVGSGTATQSGAHINAALGQRYLMMRRAGVPVSMASDWGDGGAYGHGSTIEQVTQGAPLTVATHGGWTSAYGLGLGVFGTSAPFIATSEGVNLDFAASDGQSYDAVDLYYISRTAVGEYGAFIARIDSRPVSQAVSTQAIDAIHKLTVSFTATSNPTLHVSAVTGRPLVYAVEFRSSTIHRLLLRNMAGGGSKTTDFSPTARPWQFIQAFPTYRCGLTKVMLLTNDYAHGIGPATTQAALAAIFTAVTASSDVIYESPPPGSTTVGFAPQGPYYAAALAAAQSFGLPIWDWNAREGSWARMVSEGTMGPNDALHPTPAGYRDEAEWEFESLRQLGGF